MCQRGHLNLLDAAEALAVTGGTATVTHPDVRLASVQQAPPRALQQHRSTYLTLPPRTPIAYAWPKPMQSRSVSPLEMHLQCGTYGCGLALSMILSLTMRKRLSTNLVAEENIAAVVQVRCCPSC